MGHKKRGRKPKEVAKVVEGEAKAKANVTEADSQEANDVHQLHPMTGEAQQELKAAGVEYEIEIELCATGSTIVQFQSNSILYQDAIFTSLTGFTVSQARRVSTSSSVVLISGEKRPQHVGPIESRPPS